MTTINIQVNNSLRLAIKATPDTLLRQVVNSVCDQQQLLNPEHYVLIMHGHTLLDLSLPICSATIAPGEILQLKRAEYIRVALQLQDRQTMTQPFEVNSTLWDVLLGFEQSSKSSNSSLNLTRSTGMPLQTTNEEFISSQVYIMPVVKLLDQEYSSIQSLKSTSLKRAGLESENTTLRVMMQPTNYGIENYMDEIESEHPLHSSSQGRVNSQRCQPQSSFHLQQQAPLMGSRGGSINTVFRDGHLIGPGNAGGSNNDGGAGGSEGDAPRQTPTQDISSAMVEASQEIRQLREQQTQEAMTDRVKRLSKTSDSSADKDRFVRSMDFYQPMSHDGAGMGMGMGSNAMEMDIDSERNVPAPARASSGSPSPHDEIVRQIAHRVSQKLREAQERGNFTASYHSLLAQEIAKGQLAGVLPNSSADSRKNSAHTIDPEDLAKLMKR